MPASRVRGVSRVTGAAGSGSDPREDIARGLAALAGGLGLRPRRWARCARRRARCARRWARPPASQWLAALANGSASGLAGGLAALAGGCGLVRGRPIGLWSCPGLRSLLGHGPLRAGVAAGARKTAAGGAARPAVRRVLSPPPACPMERAAVPLRTHAGNGRLDPAEHRGGAERGESRRQAPVLQVRDAVGRRGRESAAGGRLPRPAPSPGARPRVPSPPGHPPRPAPTHPLDFLTTAPPQPQPSPMRGQRPSRLRA
jgi:hypothetical protein